MIDETILITGGSGLVGCAFNCGIKISSKDVDLRNFNDTLEFFKKIKPKYIIHAAAKVGGILSNINYKGEFFYDNIMININVLECARIVGVKKVLSFLSTCIFPDNISYPLDETKIHQGEPPNSNYAYAYAKRMIDIQNRAYYDQYKIKNIAVIPTNIYGPNDNFNLLDSHVIPALIHKCYLAKINNTDLIVWGDGTPLREFIYSFDVANICLNLLENYSDIEPVILSPSQEISIRDLIFIIAKELQFNGNIIFDATKPNGQHQKPTNNNKLKNYLPDFDFMPLEKGIKETIHWFLLNYNSIRK
jgi:GDP-L-fucose synthase